MIGYFHEKLKNGAITSVALTEKCLEQIEKKEGEIFAFLTVEKEKALARAAEVDEKIKRGEEIGILEGIPGAFKDNLCVAGGRTTAASKILDNYISPYDATAVARIKEAGAVILGKTNMDEFAMGSSTENSGYGPTKNPHDSERVPGGSSGGSAAAVASDEAIWALGSDTGGSIRQPASFCGVVGLKPTYGRVSRYGLIAMASSLDQIGPVTNSVKDAAILLSIISGEDRSDATSAESSGKKFEDFLSPDVKGMKIGIVKEHFNSLNPAMKEAMEKAVSQFEKMGAEIREILLPNNKYALGTYYIIMPCEVSSNLARFDAIKYGMRADDHKSDEKTGEVWERSLMENYLDSRHYGLGREVKKRIMLGTYALSSGYYDAYYLKAQKVRTLIKKDFENAFLNNGEDSVDLILTPTAPTPAFRIGEKTEDPLEMYLADIFTVTANIVGVPAISVPAGKIDWEGKELPVGIQLMSKWFDEENLLRAAYAFESVLKRQSNQS